MSKLFAGHFSNSMRLFGDLHSKWRYSPRTEREDEWLDYA